MRHRTNHEWHESNNKLEEIPKLFHQLNPLECPHFLENNNIAPINAEIIDQDDEAE